MAIVKKNQAIILIKIGGGENIQWDFVAEDISALRAKGQKIIIIHGASVKRDEIAMKLGIPTQTITSPSGITSVYTDSSAIDIFLMVYCGLVNKHVVATLQKYGVNAVGLSGIDGRIWEAKRKDVVYAVDSGKTKLIKDNLTGRVEKVNTNLLQLLLHEEYTPVLCPPAISFASEIVNTDNDLAAGVLAKALGIKEIVMLFEAPGMLQDAHDQTSLISFIQRDSIDSYMQFAMGRMQKKLLGAKKAFANGVEKIYWGDGRIKHPVLCALEGKGTIIQ